MSPLEALQLDEMARTRRLMGGTVAVVALAAALIPVFGGSPVALAILGAGMAVLLGGIVWMRWVCADPARYTPGRVAVGWMVSTAGVCATVPYFGIFSPAPLVYILGIYFAGLGHSRPVAIAVYATSVAIQLGMTALVISGAIDDPGVITAAGVPVAKQIGGQALVQGVMACAFWVARGSRETTVAAVTDLHAAVRVATHREALLQEARADLERALRVGEPGRFTDQTVGSFRLGVIIGRGAMAEVYEAMHVGSGEPAAVKLLRRDATTQPNVVRRFLREAEAVAALDVPNVVRVLEVGDDTSPLPYIAMERLRGEDLAERLRACPRLPAAKVVALIREVARGVDAAGAAGIVHRDLKPHNLFRHRPGGDAPAVWKILDFGVSKLMEHGGTLTEGHLVGTPAYMAPEQARGHVVDIRADVHALGVIAYRALTGELPFRGSDPPTILYNVVHTTPPPPSLLVEVPAAVDAVLARALAKVPDDRYPTATTFAEALAAALPGQAPS
ncbi:MAG: serine/threonine protein kinase [Kofleriaceae bacterium]|nr:serine/threonine protein kinase [Kofleriaceae bacterium]